MKFYLEDGSPAAIRDCPVRVVTESGAEMSMLLSDLLESVANSNANTDGGADVDIKITAGETRPVGSIFPTDGTFENYQEKTRDTAVYPVIVHPCVYPMLGLANEAGELAGKVKKAFRDGRGFDEPTKAKIKAEAGDCLWYLARLCDELGISLRAVAESNIAKLKSRKERGTLKGDGDDR